MQDSEYQIIAVLVKAERDISLEKYGFVKRFDRHPIRFLI